MGRHVSSARRGARRRSVALALAGTTTAIVGVIAITTTAGTAGTPPDRGNGAPPSPGPHKVTLCHATGSRTNPYVAITVDDDAIVREGHGGHAGPLFAPDLPDHEAWGDVVPAFDFGPGAVYGGDNWSDAGRQLLAAGCRVPKDDGGHPGGPPATRPDHPGGKPPHTTPEHPAHPGPPASTPGNGQGGGPKTTAAPTPTTVAVKGASVAAPPTTAVSSSSLPVTGAPAGALVAAALALMGAGAGVMALRRRAH
jgi:LPXTG-motif cell wall-anchored protein